MGNSNLLKLLCSIWVVGFIYFAYLWSNQPEKTAHSQEINNPTNKAQPKRKDLVSKTEPSKQKATSRKKIIFKKRKVASKAQYKTLTNIIAQLKTPKRFKRKPQTTNQWYSYFYKLFNSNPKKLIDQLFANSDQEQIDLVHRLLCEKGYLPHCSTVYNALLFNPGKSELSENQLNERISEGYEYAMYACEGFSNHACVSLAESLDRFSEQQTREFSDQISSLCQNGWTEGCLVTSQLLLAQGDQEGALQLAMEVCEEKNDCTQAGYVLLESDQKKAEEVLFKSCQFKKSECAIFLLNFPNSAHKDKVFTIMESDCSEKNDIGFSPCMSLASYHLSRNQPHLALDLLDKSCSIGNALACGSLFMLYHSSGNYSQAMVIADDKCKAKEERAIIFNPDTCQSILSSNGNPPSSVLNGYEYLDLNKDPMWNSHP